VLVQLREQCAQALAPLPPTPYLPESDWFALVQALEQARQAEAAQNRRAVQDAVEYYTLWAHQIKTPLAALRLLAQESTDSALRSALLQELFKTEQYVELVLGYLRVGSMCADLCPMHTALNTIVRDSIKKVSPLFIYKKSVHLVVEDIGLSAVTDAKWLGFVLEQLLTNAVKYTPGGTVRLYADEQALYVTDTGIGISANDLPRITERGFTGHNGHAEPHSSGLGLYLCKEVLAKLGHTLSIQSVIGQGTTVRIGFARDALLLDAPLSSHTHLTQL
jgi:signal transduction histidine kinase